MNQTLSLRDIIELMLKRSGPVLLRNAQGTMELKGDDLVMKESEGWVTIYHSSVDNSESRSHLHLRKGSYTYAQVCEREGGTSYLGFWLSKEEIGEAKPPMAIYFPSFYDWSNNKAAIEENQEYCREWIEKNGREFTLS